MRWSSSRRSPRRAWASSRKASCARGTPRVLPSGTNERGEYGQGSALTWGACFRERQCRKSNFGECPKGELRRIPIPRTRVNNTHELYLPIRFIADSSALVVERHHRGQVSLR